MKKITQSLLLILFLAFKALPALANEYDDREAIRRYAQKMVDEDAQQMEAAKKRADKAAQSASSDGGSVFMVVLFIGICFLIAYAISKNKK